MPELTPMKRAERILAAHLALGVRTSVAAKMAGLNAARVREIVKGRADRDAAESTLLKLEASLERLATERFQELAGIALMPCPALGIVKALAPSIGVLANLLGGELTRQTSKDWPMVDDDGRFREMTMSEMSADLVRISGEMRKMVEQQRA